MQKKFLELHLCKNFKDFALGTGGNMNIQSVQSYNSTKNSQLKSSNLSSSIMNSAKAKETYSLSFGTGYGGGQLSRMVNACERIENLLRTAEGLKELAESFHKRPNDEIILLSEVRKKGFSSERFNNLKTFCLGVLDVKATEQKYKRFKGSIDEVIKRKAGSSQAEKKRLDDKADKCYKEYDLGYVFHTIWNPEYKP